MLDIEPIEFSNNWFKNYDLISGKITALHLKNCLSLIFRNSDVSKGIRELWMESSVLKTLTSTPAFPGQWPPKNFRDEKSECFVQNFDSKLIQAMHLEKLNTSLTRLLGIASWIQIDRLPWRVMELHHRTIRSSQSATFPDNLSPNIAVVFEIWRNSHKQRFLIFIAIAYLSSIQ